jgi:hypothetical protein
MRLALRLGSLILFSAALSCDHEIITACCTNGDARLRVINAFTTPVDVLVDGSVAIQGLGAGMVGTASPAVGNHTILLRAANGSSTSQVVSTTSGALNSIAAVRSSNGVVGSAVLDDTGSVVPAGKTKVRVIHFAANAGVLQVYRTQPDFPQPVSWQFPFTYQAEFNSLSAPFYQSTAGTWEIHVWQTPADASGWATAPVKVTIPLGSGEKKTVLILDNPGGGVRVELL